MKRHDAGGYTMNLVNDALMWNQGGRMAAF